MNDRPMGSYATITWTALRVVAGFLLMSHGVQKLFGWIGGMDGAGQAAAFPALPWFAGVIETFGGLFVLLGLFTRPVAFLLAGELAVAYFMVHAPQAFWPSQNSACLRTSSERS